MSIFTKDNMAVSPIHIGGKEKTGISTTCFSKLEPKNYIFDHSRTKGFSGFWCGLLPSFRSFHNGTNMVRKTADFGFERIRRSGLQQNLKNRQIQMIAIGGSIGTGLFVGSGTALDLSGPGSFILCDSLASTTILISIQALSELMVTLPASRSFLSLNTRFTSSACAFCVS